MLQTPTQNEVIDQLTIGSWYKSTITYSFVNVWPANTSPEFIVDGASEGNFRPLSDSQKNAFNFAAQLWRDVSGASIDFVANPDVADFKVAGYDQWLGQTFSTKYDTVPSDGEFDRKMTDAYIWMDFDDEVISPNTVSLRAIIHEFGHALGLDHAGNYNFEASVLDASSSQDTTLYSVMSYFGPDRIDGLNYVETADWTIGDMTYMPQTPMMNDILALQAMYGSNSTTRDGDTVYGFNAIGVGELSRIYDFNVNQYPVLCIYDAGGDSDTLDLSGWSSNAIISLIPGTFSDANDMTKNISIARGTIIENAIGGSGNDSITGNDVANLLVGGKGNDKLIGGDLSSQDIDTADYSPSRSANVGMTSGITVNMSLGSGQVTNDGFGNRDTLVSIEKIIGTDSHDFIYFGGPLKIVDGGGGSDKVSFYHSTSAVQINLNEPTQHGGSSGEVELHNVEEADGSAFDDIIRLKDTGYTFTWANAGNDTIYGGHGNSVGYGDAGNDTFYHLGGISTFDGGAGTNALSLVLADSAGYRFNIGASGTVKSIDGSADEVSFTKVAKFVGSSGNDEFILSAQRGWSYNGGDGVDTLRMHSGSSNPTAAGFNIDLNTGQVWDSNLWYKYGEVSSFEVIYGAQGYDKVIGGSQDLTFYSNGGYDDLIAGSGKETFIGGQYREGVSYERSTSGVTVDLRNELQHGGWAEGDRLISVERLIGSNHADNLHGKATNGNYIDGFAGADHIYVYGGGEYRGGAGDDTFHFVSNTPGWATLEVRGGDNADTYLIEGTGLGNIFVRDFTAEDNLYFNNGLDSGDIIVNSYSDGVVIKSQFFDGEIRLYGAQNLGLTANDFFFV